MVGFQDAGTSTQETLLDEEMQRREDTLRQSFATEQNMSVEPEARVSSETQDFATQALDALDSAKSSSPELETARSNLETLRETPEAAQELTGEGISQLQQAMEALQQLVNDPRLSGLAQEGVEKLDDLINSPTVVGVANQGIEAINDATREFRADAQAKYEEMAEGFPRGEGAEERAAQALSEAKAEEAQEVGVRGNTVNLDPVKIEAEDKPEAAAAKGSYDVDKNNQWQREQIDNAQAKVKEQLADTTLSDDQRAVLEAKQETLAQLEQRSTAIVNGDMADASVAEKGGEMQDITRDLRALESAKGEDAVREVYERVNEKSAERETAPTQEDATYPTDKELAESGARAQATLDAGLQNAEEPGSRLNINMPVEEKVMMEAVADAGHGTMRMAAPNAIENEDPMAKALALFHAGGHWDGSQEPARVDSPQDAALPARSEGINIELKGDAGHDLKVASAVHSSVEAEERVASR